MVFVAGVVFLAKGRTLRAFFLLVLGIWALERAQFDTSPFLPLMAYVLGVAIEMQLFFGGPAALCVYHISINSRSILLSVTKHPNAMLYP